MKEKHFLDATLDAMREAEELARASIGKSRACSQIEARKRRRARLERRWSAICSKVGASSYAVEPLELTRSIPRTAPVGEKRGSRGQDVAVSGRASD